MKARALIEALTTEGRGSSKREQILRKLEAVRKRKSLSAHVAQMYTSAFGPVPSHAYDDPNDPWWSSEAAEALLQELTDMLAPDTTYGVKPQTPERTGRPFSAPWPPQDSIRLSAPYGWMD